LGRRINCRFDWLLGNNFVTFFALRIRLRLQNSPCLAQKLKRNRSAQKLARPCHFLGDTTVILAKCVRFEAFRQFAKEHDRSF
jgi:hypothetical protein